MIIEIVLGHNNKSQTQSFDDCQKRCKCPHKIEIPKITHVNDRNNIGVFVFVFIDVLFRIVFQIFYVIL